MCTHSHVDLFQRIEKIHHLGLSFSLAMLNEKKLHPQASTKKGKRIKVKLIIQTKLLIIKIHIMNEIKAYVS